MTSSATTREPEPGREVQQREPAEAEHQHDLLGRVGDRGQRVAAEDRQRQPLGQQGLVEPVAAQRTADEHAFREQGHGFSVGPDRRIGTLLDGSLAARSRLLMRP